MLAAAFIAARTAAAQSGLPKITVDYVPMFDAACGDASRIPVEDGAVEELIRRLPGLQQYWEQEAPQLLAAVTAVSGVPFRFGEARVALFLCRGFPSMSHPLMINARSYVSATADGQVAPLVDFSNVILH